MKPIWRWPISRHWPPINKPTRRRSWRLNVIDKHKNFAPMYDVLYFHYMTDKKTAEAENVLKRKVENNPKQANFRVQLAAHYMCTQQKAEFDKTIQALNDEKQYPEGHLVAGDFYFYRTRDFDAARAQYEAGAKAFPKEKRFTRSGWWSCWPPPARAPRRISCWPRFSRKIPRTRTPSRCARR